MSSVDERLAELYLELEQGYIHADGSKAACSLIASELADILTHEGRSPNIVCFQTKESRDVLVPLRYAGRTNWGAHVVCECDGKIYDPLAPAPIASEEYTQKIFGRTDLHVTTMSSKEAKELINWGLSAKRGRSNYL